MKETWLTGQSADIVEDNIQKLKQLFPEVFAEDSIDFDKLKAVLGENVDEGEERYNFTWWGKSKALRLAQTPSTGTLRPCPEESKNWDTTQNLYIEGENLEVLKLLQKPYHNRIKMIYIDPPYNTGTDLLYKNDFSEKLENYIKFSKQVDGGGIKLSTNIETYGRYHSDWLSIMYSRLRLARNLLSDDGIICVTIDDYEMPRLWIILNEIFGEENHLGTVVIRINPGGRKSKRKIAAQHEYALYFSKNSNTEIEKLPISHQDKSHTYLVDEDGSLYEERNLRKEGADSLAKDGSNRYYPIYYDPISGEISSTKVLPEKILPIDTSGQKRIWRRGKKVIDWMAKKKELFIKETNHGKQVYFKFRGGLEGETPKSFWESSKYSASEHGTNVVSKLFDSGDIFSFPKSIHAVTDCIRIGLGESDSIILDFFSGSATTAHSVFLLNAETSRSHKFIMVQLPEPTNEKSEAYKKGYKNICEIGKERIRLAGDQVRRDLREEGNKSNQQVSFSEQETLLNPDDLDIGFKVFKLDTSNFKKWEPDIDNLESSLFNSIENFVDERSEVDIVYEIMLKFGIDLTFPVEKYMIGNKTIHCVGGGAMMICLDNQITTDVAQKIVSLKKELNPAIVRVVFRDTGFSDDSAKTNTKEILRTNGVDEIVSI